MNLQYTFDVTYLYIIQYNNMIIKERLTNFYGSSPLRGTLPVSFEDIEDELSASQCLVGKYTTLLEKLLEPDSQRDGCNVPVHLLKQALYNTRQHVDFLRIILVRESVGHWIHRLVGADESVHPRAFCFLPEQCTFMCHAHGRAADRALCAGESTSRPR